MTGVTVTGVSVTTVAVAFVFTGAVTVAVTAAVVAAVAVDAVVTVTLTVIHHHFLPFEAAALSFCSGVFTKWLLPHVVVISFILAWR